MSTGISQDVFAAAASSSLPSSNFPRSHTLLSLSNRSSSNSSSRNSEGFYSMLSAGSAAGTTISSSSSSQSSSSYPAPNSGGGNAASLHQSADKYGATLHLNVVVPELLREIKLSVTGAYTAADVKSLVLDELNGALSPAPAASNRNWQNHALFVPHSLKKSGKFLQEERMLADYDLPGHPVRSSAAPPPIPATHAAATPANDILLVVSLEFIRKQRFNWPTVGGGGALSSSFSASSFGSSCGSSSKANRSNSVSGGGGTSGGGGGSGGAGSSKSASFSLGSGSGTASSRQKFVDQVIRGELEKVEKSLRKGFDPNFQCQSGETPLTLAVHSAQPHALITALIGGGAHLDFRAQDGQTAIHKAITIGNLAALTTLLDFGASPNTPDSSGLTPLHYAIVHNVDTHCAHKLLYERALIGYPDRRGMFEVHLASRLGKAHHVELLWRFGANLDERTHARGCTALHAAAQSGQSETARILLHCGADPSLTNGAGRTAAKEARICGYPMIGQMIEETIGTMTSSASSTASPQRPPPPPPILVNVNRRVESHLLIAPQQRFKMTSSASAAPSNTQNSEQPQKFVKSQSVSSMSRYNIVAQSNNQQQYTQQEKQDSDHHQRSRSQFSSTSSKSEMAPVRPAEKDVRHDYSQEHTKKTLSQSMFSVNLSVGSSTLEKAKSNVRAPPECESVLPSSSQRNSKHKQTPEFFAAFAQNQSAPATQSVVRATVAMRNHQVAPHRTVVMQPSQPGDTFGMQFQSGQRNHHYSCILSSVETQSPAWMAGIRPGDILLEINDQVVVDKPPPFILQLLGQLSGQRGRTSTSKHCRPIVFKVASPSNDAPANPTSPPPNLIFNPNFCPSAGSWEQDDEKLSNACSVFSTASDGSSSAASSSHPQPHTHEQSRRGSDVQVNYNQAGQSRSQSNYRSDAASTSPRKVSPSSRVPVPPRRTTPNTSNSSCRNNNSRSSSSNTTQRNVNITQQQQQQQQWPLQKQQPQFQHDNRANKTIKNQIAVVPRDGDGLHQSHRSKSTSSSSASNQPPRQHSRHNIGNIVVDNYDCLDDGRTVEEGGSEANDISISVEPSLKDPYSLHVTRRKRSSGATPITPCTTSSFSGSTAVSPGLNLTVMSQPLGMQPLSPTSLSSTRFPDSSNGSSVGVPTTAITRSSTSSSSSAGFGHRRGRSSSSSATKTALLLNRKHFMQHPQ